MPPGIKCMTDSTIPRKGLLKRVSWTGTVHHFKWHAGVIHNVQDRLEYYKSNVGADRKPRYTWYKDSEKLLVGVISQGRVDMKYSMCKE